MGILFEYIFELINNLFLWFKNSKEYFLIKVVVFYYEFEFIYLF